jgi:hypothetical protein
MKRSFSAAILAVTTLIAANIPASLAADGKTFRYAFRIDPASLDPHALAETFTLSWLGQVDHHVSGGAPGRAVARGEPLRRLAARCPQSEACRMTQLLQVEGLRVEIATQRRPPRSTSRCRRRSST